MLKLAPRYIPKSLPKSLPRFAPQFLHTLLVLSLLMSLAHGMAAASPSGSSSGSFKSGFSSQRSSSSSSSKGSFGAFGKRPSSSSSQAGEPSKARGGGFGSFGGAAPSDARRSDSALSRKLDRDAAAARALRTLDERRAAQAARNAPRDVPPMRRDDNPRQADNVPPPGYGNNGNDNGRTQRSGSDLGRVIAGAVIANAAANAAAHAANNANSHGQRNETPMPAPSWNGGVDSVDGSVAHAGAAPARPKQGGSVFGTLAVLLVLALAGWLAYKWIMRARARRTADKPNYSFERN